MRRHKLLAAVLLLWTAGAPVCMAADISERCFERYEQNAFDEAIPACRNAAELGDVRSQRLMGEIHYFGYGVKKDAVEAVRWYRLAAEQGDADAQLAIGALYQSGEGVTKSPEEAFKWYSLAVEQDSQIYNKIAQAALAEMYERGEGIEKSLVLALKWYFICGYRSDDRELDALQKQMSPGEIAQARNLADAWKSKRERLMDSRRGI
ncbi:tetratricopeptide repeat protein [Mariprofundus erugo]|uniref:tetratricopeptide repeat protein n=1 Tax=Mariprofundus erugo TaxID=2528639 RepID=UPI0013867B14|nr:tetratricopeptide repeat protein [Mariprofundus erugo]